MAKHFALLLITLALVTADPLARILERLDTLERKNAEIEAQLNATKGHLIIVKSNECPKG